MRRLPLILVAALAVSALAGCGKAGKPQAPAGSEYPHLYPAPGLTHAPTAGPTAAAPPKEGRALPPEWDSQDMKEAFSPNGNYIDPSARQPQTLGGIPTQAILQGGPQQGTSPLDKGLGAASGSPTQPDLPTFPEPRQ